MKIPPSNTARHKVYFTIYQHCPLQLADIIQRLPNVSRETIRTALQVGRENGILQRDGFQWSVTEKAKHYFDGLDIVKDAYVPQIVQPRKYSVYDSPGLSAKYQISANGQRAGANDYKDWPSHYGRQHDDDGRR